MESIRRCWKIALSRSFIPIWEIGELAFCEYKLALYWRYGDRRCFIRNRGKELHVLADVGGGGGVNEENADAILRRILAEFERGGETSFPLCFTYGGYVFLGRPDVIRVWHKRVVSIVEVKTNTAPTVHPDERAQLLAYGYALERMYIALPSTALYLLKTDDPTCLRRGGLAACVQAGAHLYRVEYDRAAALKLIRRYVELRDGGQPTPRRGSCGSCCYRDVCPYFSPSERVNTWLSHNNKTS